MVKLLAALKTLPKQLEAKNYSCECKFYLGDEFAGFG